MPERVPSVTVVIPTYNQADFLHEALTSVRSQDFTNWRAIVVNNHSTDHTKHVVTNFNDQRIELIDFQNDGVIAASRNVGIARATSDYIAFLDSDDWWHPNKLSVCIQQLGSGADLVCHAEEWRSATTNRVVHYGPKSRTGYRNLLLGGNCLSTSAVVGRTTMFQSVGGFATNREFITAEDYELWLRVAQQQFTISIIDQVLGIFRIHSASASSSVERNSAAEMAVVAHHLRTAPFATRRVRHRREAKSHYGAARSFHINGDQRLAIRRFAQSLRLDPFSLRTYAGMCLSLLGVIRSPLRQRTTSHD